jgi:hypothetical protein
MSSRRAGMVTTEVVILMAAVLFACAVACLAIPAAVTHHYEQNRNVLAAPY